MARCGRDCGDVVYGSCNRTIRRRVRRGRASHRGSLRLDDARLVRAGRVHRSHRARWGASVAAKGHRHRIRRSTGEAILDDAPVIDWTSAESHVLLNPRMPREEEMRLRSFVTDLPGHLWLSTSGTTGALKLTALSKQAMLASAAAVNRHLQSNAKDVWYCVLPLFHVGGLGILARAFLSGASVTRSNWDAREFAANREVT